VLTGVEAQRGSDFFRIFKQKNMEYNILLSNRQVLKGVISSPGGTPGAFIIFVHGLGEHTGRYESWAALLKDERIGFTGVDLPGHGRSDGARGNIKNYSLTDEMIEILHEHVSKTFPGIPVFIYGHSLGGGIVLDYILRKNPGFKAAIVTSPWLKLSFHPSKAKIILAGIMKHIFPGLVQPSGLVVDHISHDRAVVERYNSDPLVHDKISVSLFHNAMNAASSALSNAGNLNIPLLLMHGSDDMICSPDGSREFAGKTKMAELKIWEGGYHELHNELFRNEVFAYLKAWLNKMI